MAEHKTKLLIIHNPTSGSKNTRRLSRTVASLEKANCQITLAATEFAGHATEIARIATKDDQNWSAIVAAGGDGTVAEVANGMIGSSIPIGVIPLGTVNVLAREIGIGTNLEKATDVLVNATPVAIYPGLLGDKRFLLMVGAGYDSLAVSELRGEEKRKFGALAYVFAAFRATRRFKDLNIQVKVDGQILHGASVIVSRVRLYGGPFTIAPKADLREKGLHVLILQDKGIWAALKYGAALATNRIWKMTSVRYLVAEGSVELTAEQQTPCQFDGDAGFTTPLSLSVDTEPLNILAAWPSKT